MTSGCRISVVIPTYMRRASLQQELEAFSRQTLPPGDYEVIVSIDGCEDGTREMVAGFPAPYHLRGIWQPHRGRGAACNAGIGLARGELLVLLDDDMEPGPQFLAAHLRAHAEGSRLGVMGAVPVTFDRSSPPVVEYIGTKFNHHLEKLARAEESLQLRDFYSGNFSIRRDILLEVGGFDEDFRIYGNEDLELSLRLSHAGVRLVFSPEAMARQHYTKDFAALASDNVAKGRTAVLLASKRPDTFPALKLSKYRKGLRPWRLLRTGLLGLSGLWAGTPRLVTRTVALLERFRLPRLHFCYYLALDYFYWLGARSALRDNRLRRQGLTSLEDAAGEDAAGELDR